MDNVQLSLTSPGWTNSADGSWLWRPVRGWDPGERVPGVVSASPGQRDGQWTVVRPRGQDLVLETDRARSHHLLFAYADSRWIVTDDPQHMRSHLGSWRRDHQAAEAFAHMALVPGSRTLVEGVGATESAATVVLRPDGSWEQRTWDSYRYAVEPITDEAEFDAAFDAALDRAVGRLLERTAGRSLVLPLSGGLDSRLLATWLRRLGAADIVAYTYGKPGDREGAVSRDVAAALDIPWLRIDLDVAEMARVWQGPEGARFQEQTWGMTSLPHVQDWYALRTLRRRSLIDEGAVILPGHTIVGNTHDEHLLGPAASRARVLAAIASHHTTLQGDGRAAGRLALLRRELLRTEALAPVTGERGAQELIEWFNIRERQAKYINASMKAYEAMGYDWALPMLDTEVWECWLRGSQELTATRAWYARYTSQRFSQATGQDQELYTAASTRLPAVPKRLALSVLRATGGDRALSRVRSVRAMLDHPMGFEAFATGISRPRQALRFATGTTTLGLWSELFLANRWGADLVPQD
ncbi:asparagine synthase-related protein [Actinomyces slackii]|uniref:asparagine synthase (glutamine-hydrolyzing) n=1 Tax=Actinomyces slackii TaxID=52774 RepID=A0A448KFZ4_9ACTO|nr:asparagine synthase-related protein [Actinomyces slackii]VEG75887.1 Asparagine synthase (glutamine-hydrolyzing) [Actinomyces slackii]